jgi:group I intron endonuclease
LINNKVYIGQSVSPRNRWNRHKSDAKLGKGKSHLSFAIRKYGIENFLHEILLEVYSLEEIDQAEIDHIKKYNSSDKNYGYNISLGGNGKRIVSEQTRIKIAQARLGKVATEETKSRMSQSMIGKNRSEENGMFGTLSEDTSLAKLTLLQAINIRQEYVVGIISMDDLAIKYNVSKKTILNIIHNRTYKEN